MKCRFIILIVFPLIWPQIAKSQYTGWKKESCLSHYLSGLSNIGNLEYQKKVYTVGMIGIPLSFALDHTFETYIKDHKLYNTSISKIGDIYGHRWGYTAVFTSIIITNVIQGNTYRKTCSDAGLFMEAVLTTAAITELLKRNIHRQRPIGYGKNSFPSGHTSGAFTLAVVLNHLYGQTVGTLAYGMAAFVGSTRINDKKHYLSDVFSGALIGIIVGRSFTKEHYQPVTFSYRPEPKGFEIRISSTL